MVNKRTNSEAAQRVELKRTGCYIWLIYLILGSVLMIFSIIITLFDSRRKELLHRYLRPCDDIYVIYDTAVCCAPYHIRLNIHVII